MVFGIGALGCLFAQHLQESRSTIAPADRFGLHIYGTWKSQLEILSQQGLRLLHADGTESQTQLPVTNDLDALPAADAVLVLVKSYQTSKTAALVARVLKPQGVCVTLQNGFGNREELGKRVGEQRVAVGSTSQAATWLGRGYLHHAGNGQTTLGRNRHREDLQQQLTRILRNCGMPVSLADDPGTILWTKLAINAAINPLSALLQVKNGQLLAHADCGRIMQRVLFEVCEVAGRQNVNLDPDDLNKKLFEICRTTAQNESSMLQDMRNKRQTEIDFITGKIVAIAKNYGIKTPVNDILFQKMKRLEEGVPAPIDDVVALVDQL